VRRGGGALSHVRYNVFGKVPAAGTINILANTIPGFEIGRAAQIKSAMMEITAVSDVSSAAMQLTVRAPDLGASPPSRDVARSMPKLAAGGALNRVFLRVPVYGFYDYQATDALFQVLGPTNSSFSIDFVVAYTGPVLGSGVAARTSVDKISHAEFMKMTDDDFVKQVLDEDGYVSIDHLMEEYRKRMALLNEPDSEED